MRLKVTLLLLLASFLQKEFCLASFDNCDIKITNFNTYEITCPKAAEPKEEVKDESTTTTEGNTNPESERLCCRLTKKRYSFDHEMSVWGRDAPNCEAIEPENLTNEDLFFYKMVKNTTIEGNTCKFVLESGILDNESKIHM